VGRGGGGGGGEGGVGGGGVGGGGGCREKPGEIQISSEDLLGYADACGTV